MVWFAYHRMVLYAMIPMDGIIDLRVPTLEWHRTVPCTVCSLQPTKCLDYFRYTEFFSTNRVWQLL